jgi:hypothetical protein
VRNRSLFALAALALSFASFALAQPARIAPGFDLGAPQRLSPFRFGGVANGDVVLKVVPRGDAFLAFYRHETEVRVVTIDAEGRPDAGQSRPVFSLPGRNQFFLASNGARVLFLWTDGRTARVSGTDADGTPTTPAGVAIPGATQFLGAQCNSTRCLLRYWDSARPSRETAAIVSIDGAVIASGLQLPELFWRGGGGTDDGGFLLTALTGGGIPTDPYRTHLVRIDNEGRQTFDTILDTGDASVVAVAPSGSSAYAVVWHHQNYPEPDQSTYSAFLSLDGTLGERHKLMEGAELSPATIVQNGSEWLYAYHRIDWRYAIPESTQPADLFVQRLDRNLGLLGAPTQVSLSSEGNYLVSLVVNGPKVYVAWNEYLNGGFSGVIRGALLDDRANVLSRDAFVIGAIPQVPAAIASTGERTLAVWQERDTDRGVSRLLYGRVTRGGGSLDPEPRLLAEAFSIGATAASAIESDVFVVWSENRTFDYTDQRLRGAIVHMADGSVDEVALPSSLDSNLLFSVANNGASWLLAAGTQYVRISRAGIVLTPQPVLFHTHFPGSLSVASDGVRFVIVWGTYRETNCTSCGGLHFRFVGADGALTGAEERIGGEADEVWASVAFNGRDYLVASVLAGRVNVRRLSPAGALLSTATVLSPDSSVQLPLVTPLGAGWLVTWSSGARYGVRVNSDGAVVDAPFVLPSVVKLAPAPDGSAVALAALRVDVPPFGASTAAAVLEVTSQSQPRRRAAGTR